MSYRFPGNIRELQSMIFDAASRREGDTIPLEPITEHIREHSTPAESTATFPVSATSGRTHAPVPTLGRGTGISISGPFPTLDEIEDWFISEAMKRADGVQVIAAQLLGMSPATLSRRLKEKQGRCPQ
jgi:transcriptional regulator with AAA-type ATPase domain